MRKPIETRIDALPAARRRALTRAVLTSVALSTLGACGTTEAPGRAGGNSNAGASMPTLAPTTPTLTPAVEPAPDDVLLADPADSPANVTPDDDPCEETASDFDNDGFTRAQGDCNDCDANANPAALDVPDNGFDEDCNGTADDHGGVCDEAVAADAVDPVQAAAAIGLCKQTDMASRAWGLIDAHWVNPDGTPADLVKSAVGRRIIETFGTLTPRQGQKILAISSGVAEAVPLVDGEDNKNTEHPPGGNDNDRSALPEGFPMNSARCLDNLDYANPPLEEVPYWPEAVVNANDPVALEVKVRVPSNAQSMAFDFNFYTSEYPYFVCTRFNDFFVAIMEPAPNDAVSGNISFDELGQPISVNNGLLQVCTKLEGGVPPENGRATYVEQTVLNIECPLGPGELKDTGFDRGAATGWLTTEVPVTGGEVVTVRLALWDSFDTQRDSTVLLDNFRFSAEAAVTGTKPVAPPEVK